MDDELEARRRQRAEKRPPDDDEDDRCTPQGPLYKVEIRTVRGVGEVAIETENFPPYRFDNPTGFPYHAMMSTLTLPDGRQYGHGPEEPGETPAMLHRSWTDYAIHEAWNQR